MLSSKLPVYTYGNFTAEYPHSWNIMVNETGTSINSSCMVVEYTEFIPWDNPDNIISVETEDFFRFLIDVILRPMLALIGGPGNIINMIVFYKQGLKERINVCLFSLSLVDGLYMVTNTICFGEQIRLQFTTKERFGPVTRFFANNHLFVFHAFIWVSQIMSAIIASERCFCILQPLRSQTVLSTSTTTIIIIVVNVVIISLNFVTMTQFQVGCAYDPLSNDIFWTIIPGEFYLRYSKLIITLDSFVFGVVVPGLVAIVVITTTIITMRKLRQAAEWRAGTSSSSGVSQRELALTKMLVANSIFFIICAIPFVVFGFLFLAIPEVSSGGRKHNFFMTAQWILVLSSYFNSSFNIVVYYTMGSRYRQVFWQLFGVNKK